MKKTIRPGEVIAVAGGALAYYIGVRPWGCVAVGVGLYIIFVFALPKMKSQYKARKKK